jgi:hypothetical protein
MEIEEEIFLYRQMFHEELVPIVDSLDGTKDDINDYPRT